MNRPTVAVVVVNCNYGRFLSAAVESVLNQTVLPAQVVVLDDGSTDDSQAVLDAFRSRVTVVQQDNQGVVRARNAALSTVHSEFVLFLDADDMLVPDALETLLALSVSREGRNKKVALYYGAHEAFGTTHFVHRPGRWSVDRLRNSNYIALPALIRADVLRSVGGFAEALEEVGCEDWDLWLSMAERGYHGVGTDRVTFRYRFHGEQQRNQQALARLEDIRSAIHLRHPWVTRPKRMRHRLRDKVGRSISSVRGQTKRFR